MTAGQQAALAQLREIERTSEGLFELARVVESDDDSETVAAVVSLSCDDIQRTPDGLPLRAREQFVIYIDGDFPFRVPKIRTRHSRFGDFPHVQWRRQICLYQSPATEWDVSDGMYGFVDRLVHWLRRGGSNQFEAPGEPLHPPVAYFTAEAPMFIPRADTPPVDDVPWVGVAGLRLVTERRVDIVGWADPLSEPMPAVPAVAVLLPGQLPWEYPSNGGEIIKSLVQARVPKSLLLLLLAIVAREGVTGEPLYAVIGTRMRGIAGSAELRQHLTVWQISAKHADALRLSLAEVGDSEETEAVRQRIRELTGEILELSSVTWCQVREDRPEIITRRDTNTPLAWFEGKKVAIWGCGALGAAVAEALVRAGVDKLILRDKGAVAPGILSRQPYDDIDIGRSKPHALADRLRRIRPHGLDVVPILADVVLDPLDNENWTEGADVVIDASTSQIVLEKLESKRRTSRVDPVRVASMVIGHDARQGFIVMAGAGYSGGPSDVVRRTKIAVCNRDDLKHFADEFWPGAERRVPFQPEPGCSEATFVGSYADVICLAGGMLNHLSCDLRDSAAATATAHIITQPHEGVRSLNSRYADFSWEPDIVLRDPHANCDIRISRGSWREIKGWIEASRRRIGAKPETGGVLFGEHNAALGITWVTEVLGPPADSESSPNLFVCGTMGVAEANEEKEARTRGSIQFVGMWHTHPGTAPLPSATDFNGVAQVVLAKDPAPPKLLLLIIGRTARPAPWDVGAYLFARRDFENLRNGRAIRRCEVATIPRIEGNGSIGLTLSGGGSRAIAFHLGCIRALHDLGLLSRVSVISAVSGGAVITGAYAYSTGSFADFEQTVVRVLRRGLATGIAKRTLFSSHTPRAIATTIVAGGAAAAALATRGVMSITSRLRRRHGTGRGKSTVSLQPPLARWYTRTHAFEDTLRAELFGATRIEARRRHNVDVVFNACELRTGTAFRYGSSESGNWRLGRLRGNDVEVAHAVAASAAYPALLPAFDELLQFVDRNGVTTTKRVVLTDGGVFENLGVSCLEPDRQFGFNTFQTEYVVACDAGAGQFGGEEIPYGWISRMQRAFETVFRKVHDGTLKRIHTYVPHGHLRGFVLSYLGQVDTTLPIVPPDLIRRDDVASYPTDFSAMHDEDIRKLTLRGEQLTRLLVQRYCADI